MAKDTRGKVKSRRNSVNHENVYDRQVFFFSMFLLLLVSAADAKNKTKTIALFLLSA